MKHLLILAILLIIAACILYALNITNGAPNRSKNGFTRNYNSKIASIVTEKDYKINFTSLCGKKGDTLFFASSNPGKIYATTEKLESLDTISLQLPDIKRLTPAFTTTLVYPNAYIIGGNARVLIKANLLTGSTEVVKLDIGGLISKSIAINPTTFIARVIEDSTRNAVFKIFDDRGHITKTETGLIPKLGDAGFTHDGALSYDATTGLLAYVTYYLNQLTIFDTTLNILYKAHTRDTTTIAKFELKKSEKGITPKSPPLTINTFSTQQGGSIYIKSKLEADNETNNFATSSVIDEFDSKGNYIQSFYLPDGKNGRLRKFYLINNEKAIGINNNKLTVYSLNKKQ